MPFGCSIVFKELRHIRELRKNQEELIQPMTTKTSAAGRDHTGITSESHSKAAFGSKGSRSLPAYKHSEPGQAPLEAKMIAFASFGVLSIPWLATSVQRAMDIERVFQHQI